MSDYERRAWEELLGQAAKDSRTPNRASTFAQNAKSGVKQATTAAFGAVKRVPGADKALEDLARVAARGCHLLAERRQKIIGQDRWRNSAMIHSVEIRLGFVQCEIEQSVAIVHSPTLPPRTLSVQGPAGAGLSSKGD